MSVTYRCATCGRDLQHRPGDDAWVLWCPVCAQSPETVLRAERDALAARVETLTADLLRVIDERDSWFGFWKAHEQRADVAVARVETLENALRYMAEYQMTGTEQTLHIDFQGKARAALASRPDGETQG